MLPRSLAFALLGSSLLGCSLHHPGLVTPTDAGTPNTGHLGLTKDFACEVDDGEVDCWGDLEDLSPEYFRDVPPVRSIAASEWKLCMLTLAGAVWCHETRSSEPARELQGLGDVIAIGIDNVDVCAVGRDGHVRCHRGESGAVERVSGVSDAVDVSIGPHGCVRTTNGGVACWGRKRVARPLVAFTDAIDIDVVSDQVWIVERTGQVALRWRGKTSRVVGIDDAVEVAADYDGVCARRSSGAVSCWQTTGSSWLLDANTPLHAVEIPGIHEATAIALGVNRACVRERDGATRCWGDNRHFELGEASGRAWYDEPSRVDGLPPIAEVRTSGSHVCAVSRTGELWCWGEPQNYARADRWLAGNGPHRVAADVIHALLDQDIVCAQDSQSQLSCWGTVDRGCVVNIPVTTPHPLALEDGTVAVARYDDDLCTFGDYGVRCGTVHEPRMCTLVDYGNTCETVDGNAVAWPSKPLALPSGRSVVALALGAMHGCVVLDDGATWCWGWLGEQELATPTAMDSLPPLAAITAGSHHTCGLDQTGRAWCWGHEPGDEHYDPVPAEVALTPPLRTLTTGGQHICGLSETGEVWCWTGDREPARLAGFEDIVQLDARTATTCGVNRAGEVWCSGANRWRQVNPASPLLSWVPLAVAPDRRVRVVAATR